jgi:hypothetical protein
LRQTSTFDAVKKSLNSQKPFLRSQERNWRIDSSRQVQVMKPVFGYMLSSKTLNANAVTAFLAQCEGMLQPR